MPLSGYNLVIATTAREAGTVAGYVANIPNQPIVFAVSYITSVSTSRLHPDERIFNSDWLVNNFTIIVCENLLKSFSEHQMRTELK